MGKSKIKKSKQSDAQIQKRREQKKLSMRRARLKLKENPLLLEEAKKKERERYQKRKNAGKIRSVKDMTEREKRMIRKVWKEKARKYRKERKIVEETELHMKANTPPSSPSELNNAGVVQENNNSGIMKGKKVVRRNQYKLKKKIKELEERNKKLNTRLEKYRKRLSRSKKNDESNNESPRRKVRRELNSKDRNSKSKVFRKLLFAEAIRRQIHNNFKRQNSRKVKKTMLQVLTGKIVKKYRLLNQLKKITSSKMLSKCQDKTFQIVSNRDNKFERTRLNVMKFLESDKASRLCSGKKETITRKKLKKQKRYLNDTMYNLHKMFKKEYPQYQKISYPTFCRLRPFWVLYPKASDRETCLCKVHENMLLLIKKMHNCNIISEKCTSEVLKAMCCDSKSELCLNRECDQCKLNKIKIKDFQDEPVLFQKWISKKVPVAIKGEIKMCPKTMKVDVESTKKEIVKLFFSDIDKFLKHVSNIVHQYEEVSNIKKNLKRNEILMHIDFSENYLCKFNREIQSAHFGGSKPQVTIHTCVMYCQKDIKENPVSYATISACNRHDAAAIAAHLLSLKEDIKSLIPNLKKIHFLSDGPSAQYKNKTMFQLIGGYLSSQFNVDEIHWHYSESSHGKGAPDGVGAVIKRTADNLVAQQIDIPNCETLVSVLQQHCKSITVKKIEEISVNNVEKNIPKYISPFPGTMKIHEVVFKRGETNIEARSLTCLSCKSDKCAHYHLGMIKLEKMPKDKLSYYDVYSDSESEEEIENLRKPKRSDYVVVQFIGKKSIKHYIGLIMSENNSEECTIKFMRKSSGKNKFIFPTVEDIAVVEITDVVHILKQPMLDARNHYIFEIKDIQRFKNLG